MRVYTLILMRMAPVLAAASFCRQDPSVSRRGFLPFSEGSRNCVGQALALVELKAVLALLLGNFSFRCGKAPAREHTTG
jgi:cytochrome P450